MFGVVLGGMMLGERNTRESVAWDNDVGIVMLRKVMLEERR